MADKVAGYIIALDQDLDEDEAELVSDALRMIRGVSCVKRLSSNLNVNVGQMRERDAIRTKLLDFIDSLPI